jgi:hypothetical protein
MRKLSISQTKLCLCLLLVLISATCHAGGTKVAQEPQDDVMKSLAGGRGTDVIIPSKLSVEQIIRSDQRQLASVEYNRAIETARAEAYSIKSPVGEIAGVFAGVYDAAITTIANTMGGTDYTLSSRDPIVIKEALTLGANDTLRIVDTFNTVSFFPHLPSAGAVSMVTGASISAVNGTLSSVGSTFTISSTITTICAITGTTAEFEIAETAVKQPEKHDDAKNVEALRRQQQNRKIVTAALENAGAQGAGLPSVGFKGYKPYRNDGATFTVTFQSSAAEVE